MEGRTKLSLIPLLLILTLLTAVCVPLASATTVTSGYIRYVSFPSDFPTARKHPIDYGTSYLLEGEAGQVVVEFQSYSGTGPVTLKASSDAFTGDSMVTKNITEEDRYYTFTLTFNIKSEIDGHYTIDFEAKNDLGDVLDRETVRVEIWSVEHKQAADALYTAQIIVGYSPYVYTLYGARYESPEARSDLRLAINEFILSQLAYGDKDWDNAKAHAQNATELVGKADSAEKEFIKFRDVSLKTAYFLEWMTYPALIISVLAIVYIAIAIFRKIRPLSKPK